MIGRPIILRGPSQKLYAKKLVDVAKENSVVTIRPPSRTSEQNAAMWAKLEDIRRAKPEGRNYSLEAWKCVFLSALGQEYEWVPGLNDEPVPVGFHSSELSASQMHDLLTMITEYGDRMGVRWREPKRRERA